MTEPANSHPLAPEQEGPGETHNERGTVKARGGIELGAMRYVLWGGIGLAVIALLVSWAAAA
ncbi:MAG: hypothetical protein SNJ63_01460 [Sphingomonadaceae bacterium]